MLWDRSDRCLAASSCGAPNITANWIATGEKRTATLTLQATLKFSFRVYRSLWDRRA
jgi:hypothetical protein